ncbi:MAG: hypothetical protein ICV84_23200 [Flavisolibacter sp.]|nr:hypothetical protein [Flavisolibacter sp.]MBD0350091.1 hypothetical protein [Flavisolibacter sp.]
MLKPLRHYRDENSILLQEAEDSVVLREPIDEASTSRDTAGKQKKQKAIKL